jgi:predicted XRE-type DNA-binding protein
MDERMPVTASSGNVFADLGLPNPEERLLKAELGRQIRALIGSRGLSTTAVGELLGLSQPHVSNLLRGKLADSTVERLLGYLNALGEDVEIVVRPAANPARGRTIVTASARP